MKVNKGLLASYLQEQNNNPESIIITMNNFIKLFPFIIAGVCKKFNWKFNRILKPIFYIYHAYQMKQYVVLSPT
ncbi:hypothetical protein MCE_00595 [Rickettsia amblyommatis str. GAT-30V]|uniref:Uncharacterized protein n=1 Tax=Rickettsia amblyommatis (strain GAT-30V) TaxID=1105111 RepID=H8K3R5_RICAG|nr:hypothetical protein MCE_00595 [Rickettsia amblyommatis str. GAT-30V]